MRKITKQAVGALLNSKSFRDGNTEVHDRTLYLHGTPVAQIREGQLWIHTGGWNTVTTRERLNGLPGVRVNTQQGQLYLNGEPWDGRWRPVSEHREQA